MLHEEGFDVQGSVLDGHLTYAVLTMNSHSNISDDTDGTSQRETSDAVHQLWPEIAVEIIAHHI